jgi:hypothetical protein
VNRGSSRADGPRTEEDEEPIGLEGPPPLARMAAVMALADLIWNRVVVRAMGSVDEETGVAFMRAGVFPRNLAAVAGIVALSVGLFGFLRMAGYAGLLRRLCISSVAGLLMPAFVLALVVPKERVSILVVVVALAAANLLVALLGSVAVQYAAGARRVAAGIAMLSGGLVLTVLIVASVRTIAESSAATPIGLFAHHAGEISWHLVPMAVLAALFRPPAEARSERPPLRPPHAAVVVGLVLGTVALALYGESRLHVHAFETLVYGALRLTLVPEPLAWLNGITVGVGLGAAIIGMVSRSPARVQLGAAVALWLAAGYAPRAPGQLLDFALAGLLLARAAQAATRAGRDRARLQWTPVTSDDAPPT